jgi:hypothetical protein
VQLRELLALTENVRSPHLSPAFNSSLIRHQCIIAICLPGANDVVLMAQENSIAMPIMIQWDA